MGGRTALATLKRAAPMTLGFEKKRVSLTGFPDAQLLADHL